MQVACRIECNGDVFHNTVIIKHEMHVKQLLMGRNTWWTTSGATRRLGVNYTDMRNLPQNECSTTSFLRDNHSHMSWLNIDMRHEVSINLEWFYHQQTC
jgi:hypothetical protein